MMSTLTLKTANVPGLREPQLPFALLAHFTSSEPKNLIFTDRRTAIHGGKLGDIIYALPTCRALGINHLVLNVYENQDDRLRIFPAEAALQLVSLLLAQPYLREVSITRSGTRLENFGHHLEDIRYNFDLFRKVPRHLVGRWYEEFGPKFTRFRSEDLPAHLAEHFSETLGTRVDPNERWLDVQPSVLTRNKIVVSITNNWRTYPAQYWRELLSGLDDVVFVGTRREFESAAIAGAQFLETSDHLQLAEAIAGGRLFLGTVSFPYALAEALKIPRGLEICHHNLNAFPTGANGFCLHPDVLTARHQISEWLTTSHKIRYEHASPRLRTPPRRLAAQVERLKVQWLFPNEPWRTSLRRYLRSLACTLVKPLKLLTLRTV